MLKNRILAIICCLLAITCFVPFCEKTLSETKLEDDLKKIRKEVESNEKTIVRDPVLEAYDDYILWNFWFYKWVYNWNLISTIIIFIVVNLMVLVGLRFSYLQFKQSLTTKDIEEKKKPQRLKVKSASQ